MPDRKKEEDELKRITAEFYLSRSPIKMSDLPVEGWQKSLQQMHDDILYYLNKLRPLYAEEAKQPEFMAVGGKIIPMQRDTSTPVEPDTVQQVKTDTVQTSDTDYPAMKTRIRVKAALRPGLNRIIFRGYNPVFQDMPIDRILIGGYGTFDYQQKLPRTLTWDFPAGHSLAPFLTGYLHYTNKKMLPPPGESFDLYVRSTAKHGRVLTFDVTFDGLDDAFFRMNPSEYDSLSIDCPVCGAKSGQPCLVGSDMIPTFTDTHRPRIAAYRAAHNLITVLS
jgi:hypothetical protein